MSDKTAQTRAARLSAREKPPLLRLVRSDNEFLPAALEILETPPSPARLWLLVTICAFVVAALAWSWIGRIDIIATARGKVHPSGGVKVIQPEVAGRVTAIEVENGQRVRSGQALIRLDAREALADVAAQSAALEAYEAETARRRAAIGAVSTGKTSAPIVRWPSDIAELVKDRERRVLAADLSQLRSSLASLRAQAAQKETEQVGLAKTISAQENLVATQREDVAMKAELRKKGAGSEAQIVKATESLQIQQTALAQDEGRLADAKAAQRVIERNIDEATRKFLADNAQKLDDSERRVDSLRQKLAKARVALSHMVLRSPIDGVAQALSVTTIGQVLSAGQEVVRVVPRSSNLDIEAYLPNSDRGFVKEGDRAIVKVASFPFTRYGTIEARVTQLAHDAIPASSAMQAEVDPTRVRPKTSIGNAHATQSLVYPVTLKLQRKTMNIDGRVVPLSPGMAVTVEIRTGSRRILQYLFSPLIKVSSEAMRER